MRQKRGTSKVDGFPFGFTLSQKTDKGTLKQHKHNICLGFLRLFACFDDVAFVMSFLFSFECLFLVTYL